ncbi:hypothetical protein GF345_00825 [Candidatus Woesearchaeota archaeon]|nr:hypothetical protein [Candidatus Woesearchaeota archaeon]
MRVVNYALFCMIVMLFCASAAAQDNISKDFRLEFYGDHCNCDKDCGEFSSCLTDETDSFITSMNTHTDEKIEEAEQAGYKGVCTGVTVDGELMIYSMTKDCTAPQQSDDDTVAEDDDSGSDDAETEEPSDSKPNKSANRVVTISFDDDSGTSKSSAKSNDLKKITGGYSMDLVTAGIISGTIILVGFFGLMAWIAYLLQKKSVVERPPKK